MQDEREMDGCACDRCVDIAVVVYLSAVVRGAAGPDDELRFVQLAGLYASRRRISRSAFAHFGVQPGVLDAAGLHS